MDLPRPHTTASTTRLARPGHGPATDVHTAVLALDGDLGADSITAADTLTAALTADNIDVLILDLAHVPNCRPDGLAAVLRLAGELTQHGLALRLANAQPIVRMACYLDDRAVTIPVYDSVRAAALDDPDGLLEPHTHRGL